MGSEVSLVDKKRGALANGLVENQDLLAVLNSEKQKEFKENFLQFATQDYLVTTVSVREIIRFAVDITKVGLNINPAFKEVYIVPFNTKTKDGNGRDVHVMLPQAIIPLNGIQEMCYKKQFFLKLYEVFQLGKEIVSEREMTRAHQLLLKTSDPTWVDKNFVGFDVVLTDLKDELPEQIKFIEAAYVKDVTKTIKDDRFKIQSWRHKAVRRAFGDFFIPRSREVDIFDKVEHINDQILGSSEGTIDTTMEKSTLTGFEDLQSTLNPLGINLSYNDGYAIATGGKISTSQTTLNSLGFVFENNQFKCRCSEPQSRLPEPSAPPASQESNKKQTQADLFGENPVINSMDSLFLFADQLGLTLSDEFKMQKQDCIGISGGNTNGLDEKLIGAGFTKSPQGKWIRPIVDLKK